MENLDSLAKNNGANLIRLAGAENDLAIARSFISKILEKSRFGKREKRLLILAVDEAVSRSVNVKGSYDLSLQAEVNETCFKASVIDSNNDYSIDFSRAKFNKNWCQEQSKKDLSIFVILEIMDEVEYVYRRGYNNILTLIKFVPANQ